MPNSPQFEKKEDPPVLDMRKQTIRMLSTIINQNRKRKWNNEGVSIYEILAGMAMMGYANYYQKVRCK